MYVAIFFAVTAGIEAIYVCIFVWRYMTTGRKDPYRNRARKRNNVSPANQTYKRRTNGDAENAYSHEGNNENRLSMGKTTIIILNKLMQL